MGLTLGGTVAGSQARAVGSHRSYRAVSVREFKYLMDRHVTHWPGDSGEHDGFWWLSQKMGPQSTEVTLPCCSHRAAAWFQTQVRSQAPTHSGRNPQLSQRPACRNGTLRSASDSSRKDRIASTLQSPPMGPAPAADRQSQVQERTAKGRRQGRVAPAAWPRTLRGRRGLCAHLWGSGTAEVVPRSHPPPPLTAVRGVFSERHPFSYL